MQVIIIPYMNILLFGLVALSYAIFIEEEREETVTDITVTHNQEHCLYKIDDTASIMRSRHGTFVVDVTDTVVSQSLAVYGSYLEKVTWLWNSNND